MSTPRGRCFTCKYCKNPAIICPSCDRGHQYCSVECSQAGRRASQREAGRRFAGTSAGRHGNARRQSDYRRRLRTENIIPQKVTHHTSSLLRPVRKLLRCLTRPFRWRFYEQNRCSVCGQLCVTGSFERGSRDVEANYTC